LENYRKKYYEGYVTDHAYQFFNYSLAEYQYYARELSINYSLYLPIDKKVSILELGCGPGFFLFYLNQEGYHNYTGIDYSAEQLRLGEKYCKGKLIQGDILTYLEASTHKYDLVILRHVLEHLKKDEIFHLLNLVQAHMKENARFLVEVPNGGSPLFGAYNLHVDFTHEVGFTVESLRQILHASGFRLITVGPYKVKGKLKRALFALLNAIIRVISKKEIYFDTIIFAVAEKT